MHVLTRFLVVSVSLVATSACTLGNFEPKSEAVKLLAQADVSQCDFIDTVTPKSRDRWASTRTDPKIANELLTLARRDALGLGGNTVVEQSELIMGRQTFAIYNCSQV
jgi:hypothetical protein